MEWLENVLGGWGSTLLTGVGVALAAPLVLPIVGAVVRPVAKGAMKGGLYLADSAQQLIAEGAEQVSDLVAEARAEYQAGTSSSAL